MQLATDILPDYKLIFGNQVQCPNCGEMVAFEWKDNSEFVARCPLSGCATLFAIRTNGYSVLTAKIDWLNGDLFFRHDAPISSLKFPPHGGINKTNETQTN